MAKNNMMAKVGVWSFIAGLVISVFVALFMGSMTAVTMGILAVLGIIVGILNVTENELQLFLLASLVFLVAAGSMSVVVTLLPVTVATWLSTFFNAIVVFTAPAAFIVSLVALYHISKDE